MASTMSHFAVNPTIPRALLVAEIFSNILSYIKVDDCIGFWPAEYATSSAPTLFALALTCRAFSQQALDALWHTLRGIEPLIRCAGIISAPGRLQAENDYPISPTEAQLAIISRHGHRVRSLEVDIGCWQHNCHVEPFLRTLASSSKVLVPNLRRLKIGFPCESLHLALPLLGLHLQHLFISIHDCEKDDHRSHTVLQSLLSSCPSIESLTVLKSWRLDCARDVPFALSASHAIQTMQKLRAITVPAITKDALIYLGGLPSVVRISSHLPTGSDLEDILDPSRGSILFENVDGVHWEIKEWQDVEVFARLWPRKLTSMSLQSEVKFDPSLLQVLFDSLHTHEAFRNLQCIYLSESRDCQFSTTIVITIDTLRPLFYLGQLRVVDIDTKSCLSIGDNDLVEMAEAWHCLEVLLLNRTHGSMFGAAPLQRRVALPVVVRFVELLPSLKRLCIGITLSTVVDDYVMVTENLRALEPRDSGSRLESLMMNYPCDEEYIRKTFRSRLDILLEKLFPQLKPDPFGLGFLCSDTM